MESEPDAHNQFSLLVSNNFIFLQNSSSFFYEGDQLSRSNNTTSIIPPGWTQSTPIVIAIYCVLFTIGAGGNLSVVITLSRLKRHRRSRVSFMILNLAIADLVVVFFMIPLEVGWRFTSDWRAGNLGCKVFLFMRAFCLYLSSNVLVCVSLDRCFAVIYPLRVSAARRRGKLMLFCAWIVALIYSIPQSFIFHVAPHPEIPGFLQCVSFGSLRKEWETAYNLLCLVAMYFLPLVIISISYTFILCEIANRSREKVNVPITNNAMRLRCNDISHIERARQRTLRLTITIVAVFVWCWTPYVVMTLWYLFDRESASKVDATIQDSLFIMAVSNSCMNPLVYGSYALKCKCWPCKRNEKEYVGNGEKAVLQRRSTDAGSGALNTREKDEIDSRSIKEKYYLNNYQLLDPTKLNNTEKATGVVFSTKPKLFAGEQSICSSPTKKIRHPSLYEFSHAFIHDEKVRLSFHSEPLPNNHHDSDMDSGLTRSFDTGPIYEQYEMES